MDKVEFLEKLYFHELDRKQALESMFAFPAGIIAGLFGVVGYYIAHFNFSVTDQQFGNLLQLIFLVSSGFAVCALVVSSIWCARAVIGSEYEHLPGAQTMMEYWESLESWHANYTKADSASLAQTDFKKFLSHSMANCCQRNWKTNLYRSQELYRTKLSILWAMFFVVILAVCYYMNFWLFPVVTKA